MYDTSDMSVNLLNLKVIVANQLGLEISQVLAKSKFVDELNADSLDVIEIVITCEYDFDISIKDNYASKIETIEDILNYIEMLNELD
jgi:acyl carrier protein